MLVNDISTFLRQLSAYQMRQKGPFMQKTTVQEPVSKPTIFPRLVDQSEIDLAALRQDLRRDGMDAAPR